MLYIVLFLVAAALAGVVAALITAESLWAWISIGLSVLAGLLLLVDWFRRRSKGTAAEPAPQPDAEAEDGAEDEHAESEAGSDNDTEADTGAQHGAGAEAAEDAEVEHGTADTAEGAHAGTEPATEAGDIPGEEDTDAADSLIVSELESEVLVVDEYPRYHLGECDWLADRETIPLPISEARQLGFSPCALCGPDAALAAKHREGRRKFRSRTEG